MACTLRYKHMSEYDMGQYNSYSKHMAGNLKA